MATTVRTRSLIGAAAPPRLLGRLNYLARIAHPAGQPASAPTEKAGGAPASAGAARASGGATKGDAPRTSNGGAGRTQGRRLRRPRAGGSQQVGDAAAAGRRRLQRRMLTAAATRPRWPEPLNTGGRQRRRPVGARSIRKAKARAEPAARVAASAGGGTVLRFHIARPNVRMGQITIFNLKACPPFASPYLSQLMNTSGGGGNTARFTTVCHSHVSR